MGLQSTKGLGVKKFLMVVGVVFAVALVPSSALSAGGGKAKTTLVFESITEEKSPTGPTTQYNGTVSSPKNACEAERKVSVFRKKSGKNKKIGTAVARPPLMGGKHTWTVFKKGKPSPGKFYAKSKTTNKCLGAKTKVFELE